MFRSDWLLATGTSSNALDSFGVFCVAVLLCFPCATATYHFLRAEKVHFFFLVRSYTICTRRGVHIRGKELRIHVPWICGELFQSCFPIFSVFYLFFLSSKQYVLPSRPPHTVIVDVNYVRGEREKQRAPTLRVACTAAPCWLLPAALVLCTFTCTCISINLKRQ